MIYIIYHIYGYKVGCTNNLERRITEYRKKGFLPEEIEILETLTPGKTEKEAGDREWFWADKLGYKRGRHYAETLQVSSLPGSFRNMTLDQRSSAGRKGGIRAIELLSSEQRSELARAGGLAGGRKGGLRVQELRTPEERIEFGRMGGRRTAELGKTQYQIMTPEKRAEVARLGGFRTVELGLSGFQVRSECPHCGFESSVALLHRWHFDNCKKRFTNCPS